MTHQAQLANVKYRNWVRAGLGIKYVKGGLEPFCDDLATQQHCDIVNKIKLKHSLSAVSCGYCNVRTLQPNHVRTRNKQCPLAQTNCNCQYPGGKVLCPNNVCGAIYDEIIQLHASTPPAPYWKNTDARQWCTEPWSVAKCFINAPGYEQKTKASEFDSSGLLHVLINNKGFQQHIKCKISGTDVFSRVRRSRNEIFHSYTMELEDNEVNSYIDDMIELLEDEKEIKHKRDSIEAVKKLLELKQEDFIISTTDETEIRRVAITAINKKEKELENTITYAENKFKTTADEEKHDIEGKGLCIKSELEQTGQNIRQDLVTRKAELEQTGEKIRQDLVTKESELEKTGQKIRQDLVTRKSELERTGEKIRQDLVTIKSEFERTGEKISHDLETKESELERTGHNIKQDLITRKSELERTGHKIRQDLVTKEAELKQTAQLIKRNLVINENESKNEIEQKRIEATEKIQQKLEESRLQLESHKNLIERSMTNKVETRKDAVSSKERKDFQKKLIKLYESDVKKVTPLPRLYQNKRNVDEMYVPSLITEDIKNENSERLEEVRISMDKIFRNKEEPAKCVSVIGEAGSGKSTFCKMLVHFWCMAHSEQECSSIEHVIVNEMKRFDFLFYISLRYYSDCDCIEKMIEKSFHNPALGDILQNDSSKCLIVLDGLDEWNLERKYISQFQTSGLPGRQLDADYTIITTSRQWKFDALSLSDSEEDKRIKINGVDIHEMKNLTVKTVEILNDIHHKNKNAEECIIDLGKRKVSDISHTPLMLQQLVCLWFNDKLRGNSKCAIYGSMLDLFLEWKSLDTSGIQDQLYVIETLRRNTQVKHYLSYLAYETLFDKNKESTLTFSSSKLIELSIPHDVIKDCLASGILKEERNVSLSENMQSTISFFHKSVQEYLAAVHIASHFKEMLSQRDEHALTDVGKQCVDKYLGSSCKTVDDILDQSNVFIMLCGLEPRMLTNVSEYIYNVSLVDKLVVMERKKIPERQSLGTSPKLIIDIQTCIFNCIEEVLPSKQFENDHSHVYIADLYVSPSTDLLRHCHNIILKNVRSVEIKKNAYRDIAPDKEDNEAFNLAVKHLTKCDQLKVIKLKDYTRDERIYNEVTTIFATNVNMLESVSLFHINKIMVSRLVSTLPKMRQLTSLHVLAAGDNVPHNVILSLSKFLNQTTRLQYISLDISCDKWDQHKINLSKQKQLNHVEFIRSSFRMVSCQTDNLETCKLSITSVAMMKQVCNTLRKAGRLKQLYLNDEMYLTYKETSCVTDSDLSRLLSSLVSLNTLELSNFTLTDNIIIRPCDMENLIGITLVSVKMSIKTWFKFMYSLAVLPRVVTVKTGGMDIREDLFNYRMRDEKLLADAQQYVREETNLFRVHGKTLDEFSFSTKKIHTE